MKICKLKLKNLNSFRKEVELDFEKSPLNDASLVAITGPTGAGKTTLLDAICVALYGSTPRLSGQGNQNSKHLISHGEKEGFAEIIFIANGTRYLATWSAKQKGTPKVGLFYADDNKLITDKLSTRGKSLGSSQKTVSEEVESILGLDFDAFRRSVMLAQGEFAAFLKAKDEERRTILEAAAGVGIYDLLKQSLNEKINEVKAGYEEVAGGIDRIPEASHEQLVDAKLELKNLQQETDKVAAQSHQILQEKERETKRNEDFEKLQSLEKREKEILNGQAEIDNLKKEQERARLAGTLRPEKQAFHTAKSELKSAEETLSAATTEKKEVEVQVETEQADFDAKEAAYQTASTKRDQKVPVYTAAKLDVEQAKDKFAEAKKRTPDLANLNTQLDTLEVQLESRQTEQSQLEEKIQAAQTFLDENPLPLDRQYRSTRMNVLLTQLGSEEKQLKEQYKSQQDCAEKVSSLESKLEALSKEREQYLSEKDTSETALKNAENSLNALQAAGTREEWDFRKQQATKAQPIAQKYETAENDLVDAEDRLCGLSNERTVLDTECAKIEDELASQDAVCQHATKAVQDCEDKLRIALLADSVNQLRQHLHDGEPCSVCGATEHPYADVVEPEGEKQLKATEDALATAKSEAQTTQNHLQTLKTRLIQTEQNRNNTTDQIKNYNMKIGTLQSKIARFLTQWQEIYPDVGVSSEWTAEQVTQVDTAIDALGEAKQTHTQASHDYQTAMQQLETCEKDIGREEKSLSETNQESQDIAEAIEDLRKDVASTEARFWELLPESFHNVTPDEAVAQFVAKVEEVEERESELSSAKGDLKLLNSKIETDQGSLVNLKEQREALQTEVDEYRSEGEAFLNAVQEKTEGLQTEDAINAAIANLETELQSKESLRDAAGQQLQNSQNLLTQKRTTHGHCEKQYKESTEKLGMARDTYFEKLDEFGFNSPEAHDEAFRDEIQTQALTDQIDAHEDEKRQLQLDIIELETRFEENPFDPEALGEIETQAQEIEVQLQAKQQKVGAQRQKIGDLKRHLEKREALADELRKAAQELERWQRLQDTIPANALRDFALKIMFKQMGRLANVQLSYLTSERYQLKVEDIGDLAVIDRWNANEERPVETLSGGESFLTSLALALALSELSRGRAQLNSLFLDEGFGTLDAETLDTAIAALEGLRMKGRNIFLISHIQELTRRLPVKINVKKRGDGSSSIEIRG